MYTLNKIIGFFVSPTGFGAVLCAVALLARIRGRNRFALASVALAVVNFWLWSTPMMSRYLGGALERGFLVDGRMPVAESYPRSDLIELHGGGMGCCTNVSSYAEMWGGADRAWHAARLWKAGRAPRILVTSGGTDLSTAPFLLDLGVPKEAILYDFKPRNTEEEAKAVAAYCSTSGCSVASSRPKVLVVTSAWHMKRTMLMYEKFAPNVDAIPAPCDFENMFMEGRRVGPSSYVPDLVAFVGNSVSFHEWLGYWGYKYLR